MTEAEWLAANDPRPMLKHIRDGMNERKVRLFAGVCCRHMDTHLAGLCCTDAIETSERYADGETGLKDLRQYRRVMKTMAETSASMTQEDVFEWSQEQEYKAHEAALWAVYFAMQGKARQAAEHAAQAAEHAAWVANAADPDFNSADVARDDEWSYQADLLRDIIGNPFRPVSLDSAWRTPAVVALATAAYDERILPSGHLDANRLAVLADALEDAACTDEQVLLHLRGPTGPHVRGCFVLDLLLDKK
jgi:hypothetical protein